MFECMKQAMLQQRMRDLDPAAMRSEEALELATREGARYAGVDAGVLVPGKLADVIVIGLDRPHLRPLNRAAAALACSARGSDVDFTIAGGQIIVADGRCARIDEEAAMAGAQHAAGRLIARAGFGRLRENGIR
jgi:5-methylthioadenosine/S-adenosylhomocysteine deaminase